MTSNSYLMKQAALEVLKSQVETSLGCKLDNLIILDLKVLTDSLYDEYDDLIGTRVNKLIQIMNELDRSRL